MTHAARRRPGLGAGVVGLVVVVLSVGLWAMVSTPAVAAQSDAAQPAVVDTGADLFATQCVTCHGINATGIEGKGPSLRDEGPAAVDFVLRTGRMPLADQDKQAQRGPTRYSEEQIVALVDYVGGLGSGPAIPTVDAMAGDVAAGGAIFRLNCASCHVATGAGSVIGSDRRAPSLAAASAVEVGEAILVGPGAMPVFGDLSGQDVNDVAAYVGVLQEQGTTTMSGLGGVGPVAEGLAAWLLGLIPLLAFTRWIGRGRTQTQEVQQ